MYVYVCTFVRDRSSLWNLSVPWILHSRSSSSSSAHFATPHKLHTHTSAIVSSSAMVECASSLSSFLFFPFLLFFSFYLLSPFFPNFLSLLCCTIHSNPIPSLPFISFPFLILLLSQSFSSFGELLIGDNDGFLPLRRLFFGLFFIVLGVGGGRTKRPDPPGDSKLVRTDGGKCSRNLSDASWSIVIW